jgi:DNA-binding response OmpR family regulator
MPKRKVLIVEDEASITGFMKNMLVNQGCEVFITDTAKEAWEIFQREKPQSCSIDLHLTGSPNDGLDLLKQIREVDKKIFCVVFTCIVEDPVIEKVKQAGADAIFFKPTDSDELRQLIECLAGTNKGVAHG